MKTAFALFIAVIAVGLTPVFVYGWDDNSEYEGTIIENNVSVSATTGGNNGAATAGTATADVFVETKVNGEVVQYIDEHMTSTAGEPIQINKELIYIDATSTIALRASAAMKENITASASAQDVANNEVEMKAIATDALALTEKQEKLNGVTAPKIPATAFPNMLVTAGVIVLGAIGMAILFIKLFIF